MNDDDVIPIIEGDFDRVAHMFTYREQKVLTWLYGFHGEQQHSFEEVGRRFGVTQVRIRQIQAKAIDKIRDIPPEVC